MNIPHPTHKLVSARCAVITVSDTRTWDTDKSGKLIQELLSQAGHQIITYQLVKDEPKQIKSLVLNLGNNSQLDCLIFSGGTGIAPRDTTYDVISKLLTKILPGFGEIFRSLSYQEIGSRAIASRAIAGIYQQKIVFSLPGSVHAVKLGIDKLIIPELPHLLEQINSD
jgi:molybdenum cofactor biosynthesis protein B